MESNEVLDKLPKHLISLVIDQPYNAYTAQDHAIWRYVMRQNVDYLSGVAHHSYVDGLRRTGISIEEIPHMYGMNRILREIGWAAVAVDGFIPPSAFMEFQAYHVLVIAADIRPIDQIEYTPAPDIIHEAAGHAPIIADEEYAKYLVRFGEIGSRAFSSRRDYQLYEAIRHLSIVKADPYSSREDIRRAMEILDSIEKDMGEPSEMMKIRNLHWWTVEYGLIGDLDKPKIYGAGLLSSIGESYTALQDEVKKLPYHLGAKDYCFDITTKQPQLFVTPDFPTLTTVLEEYADAMALRRGGLYGLRLAIESGNTATAVYSSGLQVSGTFSALREIHGDPYFLATTGPTALNLDDKILPGHGKDYHSQGFSSPIGKLKDITTPPEDLTEGEMHSLGLTTGAEVVLTFESGIQVAGRLASILRREGRLVLLSFHDCTVSDKEDILFRPEWGVYDMAVGSRIVSAFSGPADPDGFGVSFPVPEEKTHKIVHSSSALELHALYREVRDIRQNKQGHGRIEEVWNTLKEKHPEDWLLPLEIYEYLSTHGSDDSLFRQVKDHLEGCRERDPSLDRLIRNGFKLV